MTIQVNSIRIGTYIMVASIVYLSNSQLGQLNLNWLAYCPHLGRLNLTWLTYCPRLGPLNLNESMPQLNILSF